eukprot:8604575-Ditylum_brightwellii.AAC.1
MDGMTNLEAYAFIQTYSLKKGMKEFGDKGKQAVHKELMQLHNQKVFQPIHPNKLTPLQKKCAMESLIFLTEKRDKLIKACACANDSTQRSYIAKEEETSPVAVTESTSVPQDGTKARMKIRGMLVDILIELCP